MYKARATYQLIERSSESLHGSVWSISSGELLNFQFHAWRLSCAICGESIVSNIPCLLRTLDLRVNLFKASFRGTYQVHLIFVFDFTAHHISLIIVLLVVMWYGKRMRGK